MWLIKLPFRIIALLIMAIVSVLSIFYSIALHISTLAAGLLYLLLGLCLVTLLFQHAWALAAIVFGFAVLVFLAILFAEIISLGLETLTGLLTSGTGSKSRSAASSHSAYCSRGSIFPRSSHRSAASARMRTVDETRTSVIPPLPFPIRRGPRPCPKWRRARPARPFRSFRDRQNC